MFCTNCGSSLEEGMKFCAKCGAPVEESGQEPGTTQEVSATERVLEQKEPVQKEPVQKELEQKEPVQKTKGNFLTAAILAVAALVIVAAVVVIGVRIFGNGSKDVSKQVAFVKKDALYFVKNMDKGKEPVRIVNLKNEDYYTPIYFSEDKSCLYFVCQINSEGYGKLCRVQVSRLKADEDKNEKLVEEIDSRVYWSSVQMQKKGLVLYQRENGDVCSFDGKDAREVAEDVVSWAYDEKSGKLVYTRSNSDGTSKLLVKNASSDTDEVELDDNVENIFGIYKPEYFVYKKNVDDETGAGDLYAAGASLKAEKVASDVNTVLSCDVEEKKVYYSVDEKEENPLYDYVIDSYADADEDITELKKKDCLIQVTAEQALSEDDYRYYNLFVLNGSNEGENDSEADAYENFWSWLSFDDELNMYMYGKIENGTYKEYYYDEVTSQWYYYDSEKWEEYQDSSNEAMARKELRQWLQEETFTNYSSTVYCSTYGNEPEKLVEGAVAGGVSVDAQSGLVYYQKKEVDDVKIDIKDIYDAYSVEEELLEAENEAKTVSCYRIGNGEEQESELEDVSYFYCSADGKKISLISYNDDDNSREIYLGTISGGKIKDLECLTDEGETLGWIDNDYYYFDKVEDGYGSLYKYANGKSTKLSKDIVTSSVRIYQKDYIMGYSDYDYETGLGDLVLYDEKGENRKISRDIRNYSYIDKNRIVFLKDADLCVYTGSDDIRKIEKNVDYYYCPAEMDMDN